MATTNHERVGKALDLSVHRDSRPGCGHGFRSRQDPEQAGVLAEGREGRCGHTRIVEVRSPVEQRAS